ncbi:porphobilinogen synthase [Ferrimicrobium acidiphilum]|uniref:porphobilinogen synthase n=1 Tax=Ferrimicrobium acidiphilum TaxID=121039 RepID=UPI0023F5035E|nr:porphobilinogen synthase [Ferrimicrobium acidiphilum]
MEHFRRPRRLRATAQVRDLVAETRLHRQQFILPMFVREGISHPVPIASMPGVVQHSTASAIEEVRALLDCGVSSVLLFGVTDHKDEDGSYACRSDFILQRTISEFKDTFGDSVFVFSDLCLDEYTSHGHCGVLDAMGRVDNDRTLLRYQELAQSLASAGVDMVAPSGMMDHQVAAIREALDDMHATECGILAYSAKYASALYGPFREAVDVQIADGGDRRAYQQDYRNQREALHEVELDLAEGADMVMVKPASYYLDVLAKIRAFCPVPLTAYQVSGEYSMIISASQAGFIDRKQTIIESLTAIVRAGADNVLTYFAKEAAGWI